MHHIPISDLQSVSMKFVSVITCYVSSEMLNIAHTLTFAWRCWVINQKRKRLESMPHIILFDSVQKNQVKVFV